MKFLRATDIPNFNSVPNEPIPALLQILENLS